MSFYVYLVFVGVMDCFFIVRVDSARTEER